MRCHEASGPRRRPTKAAQDAWPVWKFPSAIMFDELIGTSTLKPEVVTGLDLIILRELNGDVYFGEPRNISKDDKGRRVGMNTMRYTEDEVRRIAHMGFKTAARRRRKLWLGR